MKCPLCGAPQADTEEIAVFKHICTWCGHAWNDIDIKFDDDEPPSGDEQPESRAFL